DRACIGQTCCDLRAGPSQTVIESVRCLETEQETRRDLFQSTVRVLRCDRRRRGTACLRHIPVPERASAYVAREAAGQSERDIVPQRPGAEALTRSKNWRADRGFGCMTQRSGRADPAQTCRGAFVATKSIAPDKEIPT